MRIGKHILPVYLWGYSLFSHGIIGFSRAAVVVLGGSALTKDANSVKSLSLHDLGIFCLVGAAIQVFSYLETNPLPLFVTTTETTAVSQTVKTVSTSNEPPK